MLDKDLNYINQIDMECSVIDDDALRIKDISESCEDREIQTKTGIIVNFNEAIDEDITTIAEDAEPILKESTTNILKDVFDIGKDFNEIDMETSYYDDTDESHNNNEAQYTYDDEDDEDTNFMTEEMLEERRKKKKLKSARLVGTDGKVDADYWKNLSKAHTKTNTKGAYNTSFHFSGNPQKEAEMFNQSMGNGDFSTIADIGLVADASTIAAGDGGSSEGIGESYKDVTIEKEDYTKLLNNIFEILGFEVMRNSDGTFVAIDTCDDAEDIHSATLEGLITELNPYINDCFIFPLQITTGSNYNTCFDWSNWYNADNQAKYPKCASDIKYCDVLANHLHECII